MLVFSVVVDKLLLVFIVFTKRRVGRSVHEEAPVHDVEHHERRRKELARHGVDAECGILAITSCWRCICYCRWGGRRRRSRPSTRDTVSASADRRTSSWWRRWRRRQSERGTQRRRRRRPVVWRTGSWCSWRPKTGHLGNVRTHFHVTLQHRISVVMRDLKWVTCTWRGAQGISEIWFLREIKTYNCICISFHFCCAMLCISAADDVMRCLCVCHVRELCRNE